jgi:hypothetical protein
MREFLKGLFTDAKGRPEIKIILGAPIIVAAVVYGFLSRDWGGFATVSAFGVGLLGGAAVADAALDRSPPGGAP